MKPSKVTVPALRARKGKGPKIVVLTAYDATMARLFDEAGVDALLVGDSLGMVVQGQPNTLGVSIEDICYHGRAVARGAQRAHLVGDMPFMSFQVSPEEALRNAGRLVKEGCFEAVKLEGGVESAEAVRRIVGAGIPVMGHVGLTPQSVHAMGGFRVQGKSVEAAERVLEDARALEQAGAYAIVLEGIPSDLAARITDAVGVPTIGIGAGAECDGQVLVCYDMLGMFRERSMKFVKRYGEFGDGIVDAVRSYADEVRAARFPGPEHTYGTVAPRPLVEATGTEPLRVIAGGYGPSDA
ncbi:MAG TPA: 3-methyl-2-oxobutanoate hydroxymethyltransferase [Polyangiaceae bacterium]|nr:3-methyl-2-oxobutanoate hydroxymethyltransferase [Polyangiaceae bacterium]